MKVMFDAELFPWHSDKTTWVFASLPEELADAVDDATSISGGFGSVKVNVTLGASHWSTSLFPSKELGTYVLPIKKPVRQAEQVDAGDTVSLAVEIVHAD